MKRKIYQNVLKLDKATEYASSYSIPQNLVEHYFLWIAVCVTIYIVFSYYRHS